MKISKIPHSVRTSQWGCRVLLGNLPFSILPNNSYKEGSTCLQRDD